MEKIRKWWFGIYEYVKNCGAKKCCQAYSETNGKKFVFWEIHFEFEFACLNIFSIKSLRKNTS